jgi:hypothetical protein
MSSNIWDTEVVLDNLRMLYITYYYYYYYFPFTLAYRREPLHVWLFPVFILLSHVAYSVFVYCTTHRLYTTYFV